MINELANQAADRYRATVQVVHRETMMALDALLRQRGYQVEARWADHAMPVYHHSWTSVKIHAVDEPTYWYQTNFHMDRLNNFESRRSSFRGDIRINLRTLSAYLDELDLRKAEWLRKGKPLSHYQR